MSLKTTLFILFCRLSRSVFVNEIDFTDDDRPLPEDGQDGLSSEKYNNMIKKVRVGHVKLTDM